VPIRRQDLGSSRHQQLTVVRLLHQLDVSLSERGTALEEVVDHVRALTLLTSAASKASVRQWEAVRSEIWATRTPGDPSLNRFVSESIEVMIGVCEVGSGRPHYLTMR